MSGTKTPTDPAIRRAIERSRPVPPRPESKPPLVHGANIQQLSDELEHRYPVMGSDLDPRADKTWQGEAPALVADSLPPPSANGRQPWELRWMRQVEAYCRDAKQRSHRAELAVLQVGASNAGEHAEIKTDVASIKSDVRALKREHPKTLRSTRIWNTVGGLLIAAAGFWAWLTAHENRIAQREQLEAAKAVAASASAHPRP